MADEQSTEDEKPQKRGMPSFVKDALTGKTAIPEPAAPEKKEKAQKPAETLSKSVSLPFPNSNPSLRIVPDAILRSALFGVVGKGERQRLEREKIASFEGTEIFYTGVRLDQGDLDVWETVLHVAKRVPIGEEVRVSGYELLKLLGQTINGKNRATLAARLDRLVGCVVMIDNSKYRYTGTILNGVFRDKESHEYLISLNHRIAVLFEKSHFTQIDWQIRQGVKGQLAKWLHGFYSSHARPFPIKIETLYQLCGSQAKHIRFFKSDVIKALDSLVETSNKYGECFSYEVKENLVLVKRSPSKTQRKHIQSETQKMKKPIKTI